jgi:hypothetical protein
VADHDQPALVVLQEVAQPGDGVGVEVVGGLIQEHGFSSGVQDPGELHAATLAAGKGLQRLVQDAVRQGKVG